MAAEEGERVASMKGLLIASAVMGAVAGLIKAADEPGRNSFGHYAIHALIGAAIGLMVGAVLKEAVWPGRD